MKEYRSLDSVTLSCDLGEDDAIYREAWELGEGRIWREGGVMKLSREIYW